VRDELAWNGYAAFAPGVYARPAEPESRGAPRSTGLDAHPRLLRFTARDLPGDGPGRLAQRVGEAWALGALAAEYRAFAARYAPAVEALRHRRAPSPEQAFVVRTLLVHEYRRVRLRDPQLPPALLPPEWPGAAAYALCRAFHHAAQPLAQEHLAALVALDGDALLPTLPAFLTRFPAASG
jgi:phenylacetic acid degradation operon negative regulatory protein